MISKVGVGSVLSSSYNISDTKNRQDIEDKNIKSKKESRVDAIKKSIESGSYKIDLDKLANKIADTLL